MINSKLLLKKCNVSSQGSLNSKESLTSSPLYWKRAVSSWKQASVLCTDSLNKPQAASALKLWISNTNCPKAQPEGHFASAYLHISTALEVPGKKKVRELPSACPPAQTIFHPLVGQGCGQHPRSSHLHLSLVQVHMSEKVTCRKQHYSSCHKMEGSLPGTGTITITCMFPFPVEWMQWVFSIS